MQDRLFEKADLGKLEWGTQGGVRGCWDAEREGYEGRFYATDLDADLIGCV